jgi:hypothetical protein
MEPIEAREKNLQETPDLNPTLKLDTKKKKQTKPDIHHRRNSSGRLSEQENLNKKEQNLIDSRGRNRMEEDQVLNT